MPYSLIRPFKGHVRRARDPELHHDLHSSLTVSFTVHFAISYFVVRRWLPRITGAPAPLDWGTYSVLLTLDSPDKEASTFLHIQQAETFILALFHPLSPAGKTIVPAYGPGPEAYPQYAAFKSSYHCGHTSLDPHRWFSYESSPANR